MIYSLRNERTGPERCWQNYRKYWAGSVIWHSILAHFQALSWRQVYRVWYCNHVSLDCDGGLAQDSEHSRVGQYGFTFPALFIVCGIDLVP